MKPPIAPTHLRDLESHTQGLVRVVSDAGGDPIPPDLREALVGEPPRDEATESEADAVSPKPSTDILDFPGAVAGVPEDADEIPGARPVAVWEVAPAAGGGAVVDEERRVSRVWFRRDWLDGHGLDPTQCHVLGVRGASMEPLLRDGDSILVARDRRQRCPGRIYVIRTEDGLVVKRLERDEAGAWLLTSDAGPPDWPPTPWPDGAELIGEVAWSARTYPERR